MAVPFNIPDENNSEDSASSEVLRNNSAASSQPNTPTRTRPMSIPIPLRIDNSQPSSPQHSPVDSEVLVQAFVEALCRCSQEIPNFHISAPPTPNSPFNQQGHFWFPSPSDNLNSPSTSVFSSPRSSFRMTQPSRRRLNSYGNQSQYSHFSEDSGYPFENDQTPIPEQIDQIEEEEEVPQPKTKHSNSNKKKPKDANKNSKIANFVISALQFVIDTLK